MRWLAVLVLAFALVAAGCGGDDETSASDETTVEETLTEDTSEETTEDAGTDTDAGFDFADEDCQSLLAAYLGVSQAFAAAAGGPSGDFSEQAEAFAQYADDVPDEIRGDVETLAAAYGEYVEIVRDLDLAPGEIPSAAQAQQLQDALEDIGSEDVIAASERLSAWTSQNCTG